MSAQYTKTFQQSKVQHANKHTNLTPQEQLQAVVFAIEICFKFSFNTSKEARDQSV